MIFYAGQGARKFTHCPIPCLVNIGFAKPSILLHPENSGQRTMCISLGSSTSVASVNHKLLGYNRRGRLYSNIHCTICFSPAPVTLIKARIDVLNAEWFVLTSSDRLDFPHHLLKVSVDNVRNTWLTWLKWCTWQIVIDCRNALFNSNWIKPSIVNKAS